MFTKLCHMWSYGNDMTRTLQVLHAPVHLAVLS